MTQDKQVILMIDGNPMKQIPLKWTTVQLFMRKMPDGWYLMRAGTAAGMFHIHDNAVVGCFNGSRICMECGKEWSEELEAIIYLQLGVHW